MKSTLKLFNTLLVVALSVSMIFSAPLSSLAALTTVGGLEKVQLIKGDLKTIPVNGLERVSVTDPEIADIADANEDEVLLLAKETGQTVLFIWESGVKRTLMVRVIEEHLNVLAERVKNILVNAGLGRGVEIRMSSLEGKVILSGAVPEEDMERMETVLEPFSDRVINLVREENIEDLIEIDMQITELNTTLQKAVGFDWTSSTDDNDPSYQFTETLPNQDGSLGDLFKVGDFARTSQIIATVNALVQEGRGEILSKPRLVVANGKEASFLVGGEIPIRTTNSNATGGNVQEDVEFKEYGVNLIITPTIRKGKVDVLLNVEISDIDAANAVGDDVAFTTRTAQTHLFLEDEQTIVLAGLIKKQEGETIKRVPFLSSIPVLGALFRSRATTVPNQDTEVVISLTPKILTDKPVSGYEEATAEPRIITDEMDATSKTSGGDAMDVMIEDMSAGLSAEERAGLIQPEYEDMPMVSKTVSSSGASVPAIMGPYVQDVQRTISEAISYPYEAQKNGWEGTVKLTLRILRNGVVDDVVLKETSGFAIFDQDAMNTARILSPFDRFPSNLNLEEIVVTVPIVYSMNSFLDNVVQR